MRDRLLIFLLLASVLLSCKPEALPVTFGEEEKGADLTLTFKMSDIMAAVEGAASTRALPYSAPEGTVTKSQHASDPNVLIAEKSEIKSLLLLLGRPAPGGVLGNGRVVGYRLFLTPYSDGYRYFYKNVNGALSSPEHLGVVEDGQLLVDRKLSNLKVTDGETVTWQYTNWDSDPNGDDTTPPDSPYGENGFARSEGSPYNDLVKVHFDYDNPLHGDIEKLKAGEYYIVAIANFAESPLDCFGHIPGCHVQEMVSYWERHKNDADFDGLLPGPVADPDAELGLYRGYTPLLLGRIKLNDAQVTHYEISPSEPTDQDLIQSESYVTDKGSDIISTFASPAVLEAGENSRSYQMERLFSRVTFYLQNASTSPIIVRDFSLSNNFASSATYVYTYFEDFLGGYFPANWTGQPDVQSDRNLLKFTPDLLYTKLDEGTADDKTYVIYDGLMLESADSLNPMSFTIEVDLPGLGGETYIETTYEPEVGRSVFESVAHDMDNGDWAYGETRYYLIQSIISHVSGYNGKQMFIRNKANGQIGGEGSANADSHVEVSNLTTDGDLSFVWGFKRTSASNPRQIKIFNAGIESENKWIRVNGRTENSTLLYSNEAQAAVFDLSHYDRGGNNNRLLNGVEGAVAFTSVFDSRNVYLNLISTGGKAKLNQIVSIETWNDEGSHFDIYRVNVIEDEVTPGMPHKRETFSINTVDLLTGTTLPLYELRRNDHLEVQITVRHSETYSGVDFEVKTWDRSDNTVVFN